MKCHYCTLAMPPLAEKAPPHLVIAEHTIYFCEESHRQLWMDELVSPKNNSIIKAVRAHDTNTYPGRRQQAYIDVHRSNGVRRMGGGTEIATKGKKDGLVMVLSVKNYIGRMHKVIEATIQQDPNFVTVLINGEVVYMTKKMDASI